ncbi:hypothetical protein Scep_005682 [Stephania cephalantha]|uniref:Endoglucanase n=1 Tax=Stephania cephalantha TaxID=152367 RepID=A0AAP0KW78_9MAGN
MAASMSLNIYLAMLFSLLLSVQEITCHADYKAALTKSLLYFEAQRSGKLPLNQRVHWRGDSGLHDGSDAKIDLVGGYYDSGDNVKFGFPMAFTVTMLAWSAVDFNYQLKANMELQHTLEAIRWGTDYLLKAHPEPYVLYGEVGDGSSDHACWMRPEDMTTPRTTFRIDAQHPGSDLAAETSAALAAASVAFTGIDSRYANLLLTHSKQLFDFAMKYQGEYQNSISVAGQFYSSSGFQDELLWAAAWLHRATGNPTYLNYLNSMAGNGGTRSEFSWDDKYVGAQVLISKLVLEGKVGYTGTWAQCKSQAEQFICSCAQKGNSNVKRTPGGLLRFQPWNNLQYVSSAAFIASAYSKYLSAHNSTIQCQSGVLRANDLTTFVKSQVDYILGSNPKQMSYMVGVGTNYPKEVHHRGASIVSIKASPAPVECKEGFTKWFNRNEPNPNVLDGAIVGGPDENDGYTDSRSNFQQAEPATVTIAPMVGVLANLA